MKSNSSEAVKYLIDILKNKISEINDDIQKNSYIMETDEIDDIFILLNTNPYEIINENIELQIGLLLKEIKSPEILSQLLSDIEILKIVAIAKQKGMNISFNQEELDKLSNIINILKQANDVRKEKRKEKQKIILQNQTMVLDYSKIYDKLKAGFNGIEHLSSDEIQLIMLLISKQPTKYKVEILEYIKKFQDEIHFNIIKNLRTEVFYEEDEVVNSESISEELLINIFAQYGFDFSIISDEYKNKIRNKCDVTKILEILSIIISNDEFNFIKMYGRGENKSSAQKKKEFRQLYFILKYANREILEYLLNDALNRKVRLEEIFKIDGVFKKVGDRSGEYNIGGNGDTETVSGCYEYYRANSKILDDLSKYWINEYNNSDINFYKDALDFAPDLFKVPPDVLKLNIKIFDQYGLSLVERIADTYKLKAPTTLLTRKCAENADILIEADCYDYILNYPSILKEELTIKKCLYQKRKGLLEFTNSGKLKYIRTMDIPADLESVIDRQHIIDLGNDIPQVYIEAALKAEKYSENYEVDEYIGILEAENRVEKYNGLAYNINGVLVSSLKFKRIWNSIIKVSDKVEVSQDKLLLYAFTFGSYYSEEEFEILKEYSKQIVGGQK